jgi:hypothetical protein
MLYPILRAFFAIFMVIFFCGAVDVYGQSPQLDLLTDPEFALGFSEIAPVQVRFSGPDGPIAAAAIGFTPLSNTGDTYLSQLRDNTNADGVAETLIIAGHEEVDFAILISVPNDDTVEPIAVRVRVTANPGQLEAKYPGDFSSMQEAIDALADGGVLKIARGRHLIEEPVFIYGKRIVIKGVGSGIRINSKNRRRRPLTHLIGRPPRPVLDANRNVILPIERAEGLFNAIAADVVFRDLRVSGFDAGIVVKNNTEGQFGTTTVSNVLIRDTGRGIVGVSSGDLFVKSSLINGALWHGVVISPPPSPVLNKVQLENIWVSNPGGAGIYFNGDSVGVVSGGEVAGALEGGVVCNGCELYVTNSDIHDNHKSGILLLLTKTAHISGNLIRDNKPDFFTSYFGDGIVSVLSTIHVWNNYILNHPRASLSNFGGHAALGNNILQCAGYELEGEPYLGHQFTFTDALGNYCGCPKAAGQCVVDSAGLQPPEPSVPIK